MTSPSASAIEALLKNSCAPFGIDPRNIAAESITRHGYDQFVLDENGSRVWGAGHSTVRVPRLWPSGFPLLLVAALANLRNGSDASARLLEELASDATGAGA